MIGWSGWLARRERRSSGASPDRCVGGIFLLAAIVRVSGQGEGARSFNCGATPVAFLIQINILPQVTLCNGNALLRRRVMSTYHVSFFKNLLSSDGHPFKCLQRRIDVSNVESATQATESASRAFEALHGCPWRLHADSIEVMVADPQ
jgi:hypothetical protein